MLTRIPDSSNAVPDDRPLLEPLRNYTVPEAARAVGVAAITIWRALESGHLKYYRVGRRVICNGGQHLIPWLEAGGKTNKAQHSDRLKLLDSAQRSNCHISHYV